MEFSQKDIKRAIRDFGRAIENLHAAGHTVYDTRVVEFINLVKDNAVLNHIVGPYLALEVDYSKVFPETHGIARFKLPSDKEIQIAYVLQTMLSCAEGPRRVSDHAFMIFRKSSFNENLFQWNQEILFPCLNELMVKLDDLIEDEVEGNERVEASSLQIVNYGTITARNSNVAIGKDITQAIKTGVSDEIVKQALEQKMIDEGQVASVKEVTDEIEAELQSENPSQGKLKELAGKLFDLGKKGLLNVANSVIDDPQWVTAVSSYLMSLI